MTSQWITEQLHPFYRKSLRCQEMLLDQDIHQAAFALPEFFRRYLI